MTQTFPLVTIGIPTYNREKLLQQCLLSAVKQDYPKIEIIVSDNASTDKTYNICQSLMKKYNNIKYYRQKKNICATDNFNTVLKLSSGTYFMWLSDDDWIDKNYVSECIKIMVKRPNISVVSGKINYYGANDVFLYTGIVMNINSKHSNKRLYQYFSMVKHNGIFYGLMKKDVINKLGLKNVLGGDWLLMSSLFFLGKGYTLNTTYLHRRKGGMSSDSKKLAKNYNSKFLDYYFPRVSVGINIFIHILSDPLFKKLSLPKRVMLSSICIFFAFKKKILSVIYPHKYIESSKK